MSISTGFLSAFAEQNLLWILAGLSAMCLILLIICIVLLVRTRKPHGKLKAEELDADKVIEALENLDERI
ncbi:MAG: hypothetical protein J5758_00070, partial [Abditibacteriota bacterium]|nr:hypothetical protein [Abditibacteriota bacterium]